MEPIWYSVWPKNVPRSIEQCDRPVYSVIDDNFRLYPDRIAVSFYGKAFKYRDLWEFSNAAAKTLSEQGVGYGDTVAMVMFNSVEQIAYFFGALKAGATVALIDPLTISEDLKFQIEMGKPKLLLVDNEVYDREREVVETLNIMHLTPKLDRAGDFKAPPLNPSKDIALMIYYAGVAERTLGILHTHTGLLTCCKAATEFLKLPGETSILVFLPLSHIFGLLMVIQAFYVSGHVLLMKRWNIDEVQKYIGDDKVDILPAPPMVFDELLAKVDKKILRKLKLGITGAAYVPPDLQKSFFEEIGVPLIQVYGLSEGLLVTMQHPTHKIYGSIGIPIPNVDINIINVKTGRPVGINEVGELVVRSPWVMRGYIEDEETKKAFLNGWMRTGDLVSIDEKGYLYFMGLRKRFIKYKAYPIFPRDLEILLMKHPAVEEVEVYGEADPEVGQIPVAKVKLKEDYKGKVSDKELMDYVNSKVAFYKKIRKIQFIE